MKKKIDWNKAIGIAGLLLTCFAIGIAYLGIQASENIAIKSGVYEKPKTRLFLGNELLSQESNQDITFGFDFPDNSVVFARLPLVLKNDGEKALKNASITIRYPNMVNIAVSNDYISMDTQGPFFKEYGRKFDRIGNFDYISQYMECINPGQSIHIGDIFSLNKTVINDVFDVPGFNEKLFYEFFFSIELLVTISSEGERQKDFKINLSAFDAKDMNELKDKYKKYLSKLANQLRLDTNFAHYFLGCLKNKENSTVLVYPHHTVISVPETGDSKIYFPTTNPNDDEISVASYKLFSFSRLFVFK